MLTLPESVRIYLAMTPTDMRKGFDGLSALIEKELGGDVYSGHLFVFVWRRGDRVKIHISSAGDVDVGGTVVQLAAGGEHTCALLEGGAARCWGLATSGQLGYGNMDPIGDDEYPNDAGDVPCR